MTEIRYNVKTAEGEKLVVKTKSEADSIVANKGGTYTLQYVENKSDSEAHRSKWARELPTSNFKE